MYDLWVFDVVIRIDATSIEYAQASIPSESCHNTNNDLFVQEDSLYGQFRYNGGIP